MTQWRKIRYLKESLEATDQESKWFCDLILPEPLASWDVFSYWEVERFRSMQKHLTHEDVLFDVGAEMGWLSVVYSKICKNVFLVEPTKEFWPNIRQTAERNGFSPIGYYSGLLGHKTDDNITTREHFMNWPKESQGNLIDKNKYQYLHENDGTIPKMKFDDLVNCSGIRPTAITMDVEGAELLVLEGAWQTLTMIRPKVWVSIHTDLMHRDYGTTKEELISFMADAQYEAHFLAKDHEEHWLFLPKAGGYPGKL